MTQTNTTPTHDEQAVDATVHEAIAASGNTDLVAKQVYEEHVRPLEAEARMLRQNLRTLRDRIEALRGFFDAPAEKS
jgi:hypothetical protein